MIFSGQRDSGHFQRVRSLADQRQGIFGRQNATVADQAIERLSRRAPSSGVAAALAQSLRGHELFAAGRFDDAVRAFDAGILDASDVVRAQSPVLQQYTDRLVRAQALDSLGRPAEATRWYRTLRDGPTVWGAPFLAAWIAGDRPSSPPRSQER